MGLVIRRKVVERHGGNMTAGKVPAKGSTFIIRLPYQQDESKMP
jgi:signal transduction histidine kinase